VGGWADRYVDEWVGSWMDTLRTCSSWYLSIVLHPLTPELNPSAQRYLTRFFTVDFAS
jgi:hypothetical protein